MKKPLVAIIGRPNVGKSTFFNYVVGKRISIVDSTPGVTRDRIYADADWNGKSFTLVDTGGLDNKSDDSFQKDIESQASIAIDLADVIVFIVDGKAGLTRNDEEVAEILRKSKKPIILVVNKLDNFEVELTYDFYSLGLGVPLPLSCAQGKGLGDVLDEIVKELPAVEDEANRDVIKIALVGRPNVGKSSIANRILGEKRVVVSDVAGTTRDAIDTPFRYNSKDYLLIDTAGLRRKRSFEQESIEGYSTIRTMEAIKRADIVLIVMDSADDVTEQDVRIAGYVHEEGKPSLIILNKWDLVDKDDKTIIKYKKMLDEKLKFMDYFRPAFVSTLTGKRFGEIMQNVEEVLENASRRIPTGTLNELVQNATLANEPPYRGGKKLKIKYATQVSTNPPTFVLFVNEPSLMHFSYLRYLENYFRKSVDFSGTPIKFLVKSKQSEE